MRRLTALSREEHLRAAQLLHEAKNRLREVVSLLARSQGVQKGDCLVPAVEKLDARLSNLLDRAWCRSWPVTESPYCGRPHPPSPAFDTVPGGFPPQQDNQEVDHERL